MIKISKYHARLYLLLYHHLLPSNRLEKKSGVMEYLQLVGSIQYDPLSIIDTNPNLVLQSRVKDYQASYLYDLLYHDRLLIDDWDKNQSIYLVEDWPYFRRYREKGLRSHSKINLSEEEILDEIKNMIKNIGPVSSIDLSYKDKVNWFWGETNLSKVALESLYSWGELVIHHKVGVRKYYDLTENVLPKKIYLKNDPNESLIDFYKWIVKRRIGSVGLLWNKASDAYLGIYFMKSKDRNIAFKELLKSKEIVGFEVTGINIPLYIRKSDEWILEKVLNGIKYPKEVSFIAPLDNLIWDRKLIKELFNYEYKWEVYKPVSEREYGYYVLPVLYGDEFIGRIEPIFDKKRNTLIIKNFWFEKGVEKTVDLRQKIDDAVKRFAQYLNASNIQYICKIY